MEKFIFCAALYKKGVILCLFLKSSGFLMFLAGIKMEPYLALCFKEINWVKTKLVTILSQPFSEQCFSLLRMGCTMAFSKIALLIFR